MAYTAGFRARLVRDNMHNFVNQGLSDLGWFDSGRQHQAVVMYAEAKPWDEEIKANAVMVTTEGVRESELELGSNLSEQSWEYYVDIIAESESLGIHLATDIRDLLTGHITDDMTYVGPRVPVYDLSQGGATPDLAFMVEAIDVNMDKGRLYNTPTKKHWWQVAFTVVDAYADEHYGEIPPP